jgi:hypothetical protein
MDDISKLLPPTPWYVAVPIAILTVTASLGPKIVKMFGDLNSESRRFKREKERLSLLKLSYETESFKREKNLADFTPDPNISKTFAVNAPRVGAVALSSLRYSSRFLYGALGALAPTLIRLGLVLSSPGHQNLGIGQRLACLDALPLTA